MIIQKETVHYYYYYFKLELGFLLFIGKNIFREVKQLFG